MVRNERKDGNVWQIPARNALTSEKASSLTLSILSLRCTRKMFLVPRSLFLQRLYGLATLLAQCFQRGRSLLLEVVQPLGPTFARNNILDALCSCSGFRAIKRGRQRMLSSQAMNCSPFRNWLWVIWRTMFEGVLMKVVVCCHAFFAYLLEHLHRVPTLLMEGLRKTFTFLA